MSKLIPLIDKYLILYSSLLSYKCPNNNTYFNGKAQFTQSMRIYEPEILQFAR